MELVEEVQFIFLIIFEQQQQLLRLYILQKHYPPQIRLIAAYAYFTSTIHLKQDS